MAVGVMLPGYSSAAIAASRFATRRHLRSGSTIIHLRIVKPALAAAQTAVPIPAKRSSSTMPLGGIIQGWSPLIRRHLGTASPFPRSPISASVSLRQTISMGSSIRRSQRSLHQKYGRIPNVDRQQQMRAPSRYHTGVPTRTS